MLRAIFVCAALFADAAALGANVTVFAAASLKGAFDDQARAYESLTGDRVVVSYAGSNSLARQIDSGAPADVFLCADLEWMNHLDARGLLAAGTRVNLLRNTLVLVAPAASATTLKIAPRFDLRGALQGERLAMANPDSVPAGRYGKSALETLGVWRDVSASVARAENVRAALALVSRGEVAFGIVYATDALADKGVRIVDAFPPGTHPPIVYPAAIVAASRSPAARPLLDYLRSPGARAIWQRHGFAIAP
ncbi:MAG: molybdate ABC transporter substrate-binding protein [Betaproteobacteria bacterium]